MVATNNISLLGSSLPDNIADSDIILVAVDKAEATDRKVGSVTISRLKSLINSDVKSHQFDTHAEYIVGDTVIYGSEIYQCIRATGSIVASTDAELPTDNTYWKKKTFQLSDLTEFSGLSMNAGDMLVIENNKFVNKPVSSVLSGNFLTGTQTDYDGLIAVVDTTVLSVGKPIRYVGGKLNTDTPTYTYCDQTTKMTADGDVEFNEVTAHDRVTYDNSSKAFSIKPNSGNLTLRFRAELDSKILKEIEFTIKADQDHTTSSTLEGKGSIEFTRTIPETNKSINVQVQAKGLTADSFMSSCFIEIIG